MQKLAAAILAEQENIIPDQTITPDNGGYIDQSKITETKIKIKRMLSMGPTPSVAFSGGSDSMVLLDLIRTSSGSRPAVIWADTQMEWPETKRFIEKVTSDWGYRLFTIKAPIRPVHQWDRTGWPMLGKISARNWQAKNKNLGFKINVTECCRNIKIKPARKLTKSLGCSIQLTGQKGKIDDSLRGLRTIKDREMFYQKKDNLWIANPLIGWTDADIAAYSKKQNLPQHPRRKNGAITIGCIFCGGGCQYTNSGYRVLRKLWPEAWFQFMIEWGGGLIMLALKYKRHINEVSDAVALLGGLETLAKTRPFIFDFSRIKPIPGYDKDAHGG